MLNANFICQTPFWKSDVVKQRKGAFPKVSTSEFSLTFFPASAIPCSLVYDLYA